MRVSFPIIMTYCLTMTIIIEGLAAFLLRIRKLQEQLIVMLVNILTNPILVCSTFLIQILCPRYVYWISVAAFELAAFLCEGLIYKNVLKPKINPFLLSLILNASSYFIGLGLNEIIF